MKNKKEEGRGQEGQGLREDQIRSDCRALEPTRSAEDSVLPEGCPRCSPSSTTLTEHSLANSVENSGEQTRLKGDEDKEKQL